MILFFDTETTGLPGKNANWETDFKNFPGIAQIAWVVADSPCNILYKYESVILTDKPMSPEAAAVHGITPEMILKDGMSERRVLEHFLLDAKRCETIVGHNIYFDTSIIKASMLRLEFDKDEFIKALDKTKRVDTMRMVKGGKWPKLSELYKKLFNEELVGAHGAMADVMAVKKCYFELVKSQQKEVI